MTKCSLSRGNKTRREEEEERRICHEAQWGTQQWWLLGGGPGVREGSSPQPWQTGILNRHPPRRRITVAWRCYTFNNSRWWNMRERRRALAMPACMLDEREMDAGAPQKEKRGFLPNKNYPQRLSLQFLREGSGIFHSLVLNCQPASWEILKSSAPPH